MTSFHQSSTVTVHYTKQHRIKNAIGEFYDHHREETLYSCLQIAEDPQRRD